MNILSFSFSISLQNVRKKGPAEFCQMFQLKKLVSRYLQSTVFTFKLKFHLEDGLVEQCYFELFSLTWSIFSSFKRSLLNAAVFTLFFSIFFIILVKFSAPKSSKGKFNLNLQFKSGSRPRKSPKKPKKRITQSRFAQFFNYKYGIYCIVPGESLCPDGSEYVWQRGVESLQGRVTAAQS